MEFWLSFDNGAEKLRLPVNPSSYEIVRPAANKTVNVHGVGEVNLIGLTGLASTSIDSFFPLAYQSYCQYEDFPAPQDCIEMIERWLFSGKPIRYEIKGAGVNMPVSIESFAYGESDAFGNVRFSLELKEYRFLNTTSKTITIARQTKEPPKTYTAKHGDTLHSIAKRTTGKSSNKAVIASLNKIYNGALVVGKVLLIAYNKELNKRSTSSSGGGGVSGTSNIN